MISEEHVGITRSEQQLAQGGVTGMPENIHLGVSPLLEPYTAFAKLELGLLRAEQFVGQKTPNVGQDDNTNTADANQPFDRPAFAARIRRVIAKSLAPAGNEGRIAANDFFHGWQTLGFFCGPFDETADDIGIRDETLQIVVVDDQHALHGVLDHQPRQVAHFQVLRNL